jgi:DNA-binding beta-propeller fold protein YncE
VEAFFRILLKSCALSLLLVWTAPWVSAASKTKTPHMVNVPGLEMDGGRRLLFERSFSFESELKPKRSLLTKLVDFVAGAPDMRYLVRPYSVAIDSRGHAIVADPGAMGIHIVDFAEQKYKFISRREGKDPLTGPQCVAVDKQDNIYVTDSEAGKIFVFGANGKFQRTIGSLKGGEGFFKRPTGIAVDSDAQRIYVADTWRNRIYVLDMLGSVIQTIGKRGAGNGEFNFPTELRLAGGDLLVVDAMNFRVQVLSRAGVFQYAVGHAGDGTGDLFRPKGVAMDSEGHLYVADALNGLVQVFDEHGRLLYYFGYKGTAERPLVTPAGIAIDRNDRIFVVDSTARRLQVFHYYGTVQPVPGGTR